MTTLSTALGIGNEQIVVTSDVSGPWDVTPGANDPSVGSVFDTTNFGFGFENIYSDTVGTGTGGADTITDTFVTPFGEFNIPIDFDVALNPADFSFAG